MPPKDQESREEEPRPVKLGRVTPDHYSVPVELLPAEIKAARSRLGLPTSEILFRSCPTEIKATPSKRFVELYIGAFGNVDSVGDVLMKGSAARTIEEDGPKGENLIKHMFNHAELVGPVEEISEDDHGILMVGKVDSGDACEKYLSHCGSGAVSHGSIGWGPVRSKRVTRDGQAVRELHEIKLWDGSGVTWPANRLATLVAVKAAMAGEPVAPAMDTKGLWGLIEALDAMARIEIAQRVLDSILAGDDWAPITDEEAEQAQALIESLPRLEKRLKINRGASPRTLSPGVLMALGELRAAVKDAAEGVT